MQSSSVNWANPNISFFRRSQISLFEQQSYIIITYSMPEVEHIRIQNDEFTALANIYLDEFTVLKQTAPYKFNVLCKPYTNNQFDYQINLQFQHTKQYPSSPIKYEIEPIAGITRDNINHITKKIEDIIANSNHKPVVFDIVEETRDWINVYLVEGKLEEVDDVNLLKKVEVFERPKFAAFTPVTIENFMAWKRQFDLRHRNDKAAKKQTEVKLTGKQWFLGKHDEIESSEDDQEDQDEQIEEEQEIVERQQAQNELFNNVEVQ